MPAILNIEAPKSGVVFRGGRRGHGSGIDVPEHVACIRHSGRARKCGQPGLGVAEGVVSRSSNFEDGDVGLVQVVHPELPVVATSYIGKIDVSGNSGGGIFQEKKRTTKTGNVLNVYGRSLRCVGTGKASRRTVS